jgi:hypothetical protein
MAVIRFSDEEVFDTDSQEYHILQNAANMVKNLPGAAVEIGTRRGGSAKMIIDVLKDGIPNRPMFCIDPYGNIEMMITNINQTMHFQTKPEQLQGDPMSKDVAANVRLPNWYDNTMRNRIIPSLYYYAYQNNMNFHFFCLEDTEFFKRYSDGVPVYQDYKNLCNQYALVFFDGPHDNDAVQREIDFFLPRTIVGSVFIFDDVWMYNHDKFHNIMLENGWEAVETGAVKISYKRVR